MNTDILRIAFPKSNDPLPECKCLHDAESWPFWMERDGFLSFARTSEKKENDYSLEWQRNEIRRFVLKRTGGIDVFRHHNEPGVKGDRLSLLSRPELMSLIAISQQTGYPIIAWDWTRFLRRLDLFPRLNHFGVDFLTIKPLTATQDSLRGERRRLSERQKRRQIALGGSDRELGKVLSRYMEYEGL